MIPPRPDRLRLDRPRLDHHGAAVSALPREARRLLGMQALCSLALGALFSLLLGASAGASALLGGGICLSATWVFARISLVRRDLRPRGMLNALYLGEAGKILWTICAFSLSFYFLKPHPLACMASYIMVLMSNFFILAWQR